MPPNRKPWIFINLPGICCLTALLLASLSARAQARVYPVSVTTQLAPPYSVNLADYAAPGTDQLRVIIVQRDLTQPPYRLYLRMEIQLNGRTIIRTSPDYFPPALTLDPGIPTIISGSDLSHFLDPANMQFTAYSRENYMRTKVLPEGAYVITFTAYDFARSDVALSNGGAFFCYLAKSEPPLLNLPPDNSLVLFTSPQQINFQWLPRTVTSLNSAASTNYRLELFEMRTGGMSPNEVVNSSRPVFTQETDRNSYSYSIADPLLEKGMRYAWRIKAYDTGGRDYIRNDGYSEVFSFIYGEEGRSVNYSSIENFQAQAVSSRKARLTWDVSPGYDSYKIFYRKQGNDNRWYESETREGTTEISGLSPGLIYECRVQGKSSGTWGNLSETDTVLMPVPRAIECGSSFLQPVITNRDPLLELMRLQEFDADGFMVTVTDPMAVTTKPGYFSGKGFVQVPLFSHKKIRCVFTDVFINTDYQMVEGTVRLLTDNSSGGDNALWDLDNIFEGGIANGSVNTGTEESTLIIPDIIISRPENIFLDTAKGQIVVISEKYDSIKIDVENKLAGNPGTLSVKDSEGNLYSVDTETGKSTFVGQAAAQNSVQQTAKLPQVVDDRKGIVKFGPAEDSRFAFDKKDPKYRRSNIFNEEYETIKLYDGREYDVPLKLIPAGETDKVLATIEKKGKSVSEDSIVFRSGTGTVFKPQPSGKKSEFILTLPSGKDNDGIDIYATYTSKGQTFVLGKMKVISYQVVKPKIVLVPVNGNNGGIDISSVKRELDNVYKPVAVDWQVSMDGSDFRYATDSLNIQGSGLWSRYTDGMKRLNSEFLMHKKEAFDASAIYLFLLKSSEDPQATGDMPRSVQFGYIFTEKSGNDKALYRTVAHEIAHGMFHLAHTFDNQYQIEKGTTDNLLDYTAGTLLVKHQWDAIHAPGVVMGMFERDEDAAMKSNTYYWTPAGTPFYSKSTSATIIDIDKITNGQHLNGILYSWQENGITYTADIDTAKGMFYGYINKVTRQKYKDITSLIEGQEIQVNSIMYIGDCTKEDIITKYKVPEKIDGLTYYINGAPLISRFIYIKGNKANTASINNCKKISYSGKAKEFKDYCKGKFDAAQSINIDKTALQIQLMSDKYDDYEKVMLSNNPYSIWVNTSEHLTQFYNSLSNYYQTHKDASRVDNPNCPDCPKYPNPGDVYWDTEGRNWVFWENNKWKDLSGEFCEGEACSNEWKNGIDVQFVHKFFYNTKLAQYENNTLQVSLGGINEEFKLQLWRSTQIITVHALKNSWKEDQIEDSWWIPAWGSVKSLTANIKVANGDMTFYTKAIFDGIFVATDVFLAKAIATGIYKVGIKKLIIEGGAKQITKQLYYTVCKKAVTYRLAYALRFGTPEATAFFDRQLTKTLEIYDLAQDRYIKYDLITGETLIGKVSVSEQIIIFQGYGKIPLSENLTELQKSNSIIEKIGNIISIDFFKVGDEIAGKRIYRVLQGSNGKIAIIGRQMKGHVIDVANALKAEGKIVETFSDLDQSGKIFRLDGENYRWTELIDDFSNKYGKYKTNEKGWILDSELPKTLIYKANKQWAEKLIKEGYTVLDFNFPMGINTESTFYDLEVSIIFK